MTDSASSNSDTELLTRLLAGEKAAFDLVVRRYHEPMKRVAMAIVGEAQAEEAVQEAWLTVIRRLSTFEGRSSLRTWLFTVVANEAKSRLRKGRFSGGKREVSIEDGPGDGLFDSQRWKSDGHWAQPPTQWHDSSPEALLSFEVFRKCLDMTLAILPEDQKAVLTLREFQGLDVEAICNILDISASNMRVLMHRARMKVYAMVEHFEETGKC
ncbi:MAG: sigma-70 family RNA polymerase sigma factor [Halioglobus sp.]